MHTVDFEGPREQCAGWCVIGLIPSASSASIVMEKKNVLIKIKCKCKIESSDKSKLRECQLKICAIYKCQRM